MTLGERLLTREVHTGSSYLSSNDPRLNFGVDTQTKIDRLEIRWPSGVLQTIENLSVNHGSHCNRAFIERRRS